MISKKTKRLLFNNIVYRIVMNRDKQVLNRESFVKGTKSRVCISMKKMPEIRHMMSRAENVSCYHETRGEIKTCLACLLLKNHIYRALHSYLCEDVLGLVHEYTGALCLDKHRSYLSPM